MYHRRPKRQPALLLVMFIALELIVAFAPLVGRIDLGAFMPALTLHLPVVLAGALLGLPAGAAVGLVAGLCRWVDLAFLSVDAVTTPLFSPIFAGEGGFFQVAGHGFIRFPWLSLLTGLIPPVVAGVAAAALLRLLQRSLRGSAVALGLAGAGGTLAGAAVMWLGIFINTTGSREMLWAAAGVNTAFETAAALLLCALPGALLYRKFISVD